MRYKLTTYKTLTGQRQILELPKKKNSKAIIYKDDQPSFYVDCFDLQTESNVIMNSLVLCQQQSMQSVIKQIADKHKINLSIKKAPTFAIEIRNEIKDIELPPLPEEWLN